MSLKLDRRLDDSNIGVITRLDWKAPEDEESDGDFNSNYEEAAAAASGWSPGIPVVNMDEHATALQVGGRLRVAPTDYSPPRDQPSATVSSQGPSRTMTVQKSAAVYRGWMEQSRMFIKMNCTT